MDEIERHLEYRLADFGDALLDLMASLSEADPKGPTEFEKALSQGFATFEDFFRLSSSLRDGAVTPNDEYVYRIEDLELP